MLLLGGRGCGIVVIVILKVVVKGARGQSRKGGRIVDGEGVEGRHGEVGGIHWDGVHPRGARARGGRDGRAGHAVGGGKIRHCVISTRSRATLELGDARHGGGVHALQLGDLPLQLVDPSLGFEAGLGRAGSVAGLALLLPPLGGLLLGEGRVGRLVLEIVLVGLATAVGRGGDGVQIGQGGHLPLLAGGGGRGTGGHDL